MFGFLKKKKICANCGNVNKKGINSAGYEICSEECMVEFCISRSREELIALDKKDRREKNIF